MPKIETAGICTLKIDNKEMKHTVSSVKLSQHIDDHHQLQIRIQQTVQASAEGFQDPANYTGFLGKSVAMTITAREGDASGKDMEFIGLVTDVKLENSIDGLNTVVIVAKSPTITLDGAPQVAVYRDQSVSDVIGAIVSNYPVTRGKIESTGGTMQYSVQYRETDWRYVRRLSEAAGFFAYYDGKEFCLQKANGSSEVEVKWRKTLGVFSMGLGTAASKFASKSWEYGKKTVLEGQTDSSALRSAPSNLARVSIDASQKIFERPGYQSTVKATDHASDDATLNSHVESQVGRMVTCVGESIVPAVKVGHCIKVAGMDKFDGSYWVTGVTHHFDESGKYHNDFVCSPLDVSYPPKKSSRPPMTNLQSGVVTNLDDPEGLGRIQVKIPALGIDTLWVRYAAPHAGSGHGWMSLPEVDDEVLIGYENGNPDMPVAIASLYSGTDTLPVTPDQKNEVKIFLTRAGNEIKLTDKDGEEEIKISTKDGKNVIVLSGKDPSVSITTDGDIKFESTGDFSIKGKNVKIESDAAIDVKSGADLNLEGGANLKATATGNLNVEASGQCVIKGAIINLN